MLPAGPFSLLLGSRAWAVSPLERVAAAWPSSGIDTSSRYYRADITITFLGISIFSRSDVGSGTVTVDRGNAAGNVRTVALRLAAGSLPERARGLNRLGYIQELVIERESSIIESAYFGFMTSSPEDSFTDARKALGPDSANAVVYTAVEGSSGKGVSSYRLYQMVLPGTWNYSRCDDVVRRVRDSLTHRQVQPAAAESTPSAQPSRTFLYAVREAMQSTGSRSRIPFVYNGKHYRLDVEKNYDSKTGERLAERRVVTSAANVLRLNGSIQNVGTGSKTPFRLWFAKDSDLPLRFEYRPRNYLNLAFEHAPV